MMTKLLDMDKVVDAIPEDLRALLAFIIHTDSKPLEQALMFRVKQDDWNESPFESVKEHYEKSLEYFTDADSNANG